MLWERDEEAIGWTGRWSCEWRRGMRFCIQEVWIDGKRLVIGSALEFVGNASHTLHMGSFKLFMLVSLKN
jgi:hypothetical protein